MSKSVLTAQQWFEGVSGLRSKVQKLRDDIDAAYAQAGPKGQLSGTQGGSGGSDPMAGIDAIIDSDSVAEYERLRGMLEDRMSYALQVLYGRSGRGGIARVRSTDDADILCFHYLQGESWASVGRRYKPDDANVTVWCQRQAAKTCADIDRIGFYALANS